MHLESYNCVLCAANLEETVEHLFFECSFSPWCWRFLDISWDLSVPIFERLMASRQAFGTVLFMEISVVAAWCIWTMRNSIIFDGKMPSLRCWKEQFRAELSLTILRSKSTKKSLLSDWLSSF